MAYDAHTGFPVGAILTQGLGLPADEAIITAELHMLITDISINAHPQISISGGGIPLMPGQIQTLYKPVSIENNITKNPEHPFLTPANRTYDPFVPPKTVFNVKAKFGNHEIERNFLLDKKRANALIKVLRFMKSNNKIKILGQKLQSVLKNTAIQMKTFKKR